jgi:hypothetical protein
MFIGRLSTGVRFIESPWIEVFAIILFLICMVVGPVLEPAQRIGALITGLLPMLFILRAITSLMNYRNGNTNCLINTCLCLQMTICVTAIGFVALDVLGYQLMTLLSLNALSFTSTVISLLLLVKLFRRNTWTLLWETTKWNLFRVFFAVGLCVILYYGLKMDEFVNTATP